MLLLLAVAYGVSAAQSQPLRLRQSSSSVDNIS